MSSMRASMGFTVNEREKNRITILKTKNEVKNNMSIKTTKELEKWTHILAKRVNGAVVGTSETQYGALVFYVIASGVIIFADQSWTPAIHEQAIARVCRPQQKHKPIVYKLFNSGQIDEYMKAMMDVKQEGISEGIDWKPHTFDPSTWLSFKDMSYRYLQQEGYI